MANEKTVTIRQDTITVYYADIAAKAFGEKPIQVLEYLTGKKRTAYIANQLPTGVMILKEEVTESHELTYSAPIEEYLKIATVTKIDGVKVEKVKEG